MQYLGRYELLGEIASGGLAKVYLGRVVGEGGFEREVAIKLMHEHIATDPEFVAMFLDEARLAARIRHPHVVPTVDVQRTDQGLFLVRIAAGVVRVDAGAWAGPEPRDAEISLEILAARHQENGRQTFLAREIRTASGTVLLRDAQGVPLPR